MLHYTIDEFNWNPKDKILRYRTTAPNLPGAQITIIGKRDTIVFSRSYKGVAYEVSYGTDHLLARDIQVFFEIKQIP